MLGREALEGAGVYYAATPTEFERARGADVVVVGGGNSSGQAVRYLANHARRAHLLLRGGDLRKSMSSYLAGRVENAANVEVRTHTEVRGLVGERRLEPAVLENTREGRSETIQTPALFTFIGAVPRTGWLPSEVRTDEKGFVLTGRAAGDRRARGLDRDPFSLETSLPGVLAAGDARAESVRRVASAVGEGSMAVQYVHRVLGEG